MANDGLGPEELDALPEDAVVQGSDGAAWQKLSAAEAGRWGAHDAGTCSATQLVEWYGPVRRMVVQADEVVWIVQRAFTYDPTEPVAWCTSEQDARRFAAEYWRTAAQRHAELTIFGARVNTPAWRTDSTDRVDGFRFKGDPDDAREAGWLSADGAALH